MGRVRKLSKRCKGRKEICPYPKMRTGTMPSLYTHACVHVLAKNGAVWSEGDRNEFVNHALAVKRLRILPLSRQWRC